jgi:hypothetical protein
MSKSDEDKEAEGISGSVKGDFLTPPEAADVDERADALPQEEEFWRPPIPRSQPMKMDMQDRS